MRHKFTDSALESNLQVIDCYLPTDTHGSKYHFFKSFPNPKAIEYYYCFVCNILLDFKDSETTHCEKCNVLYTKSAQRKAGHYFLYSPLKDQLIQLVKSKHFQYFRKENLEESDITSGRMYRLLRKECNIDDNDITVQWNTDGIKTFNSSKRSVWPILVQVNELPYRMRRDNMICCGIWCDAKKPPMELFLKPFIDELVELHEKGFKSTTFLHDEPITIKVHALLASVDAPARCAIQFMKQYNGKYGCNYCLHPGLELEFGRGFHRVYCGDKQETRTHEQHMRDARLVSSQTEEDDINGVKGPSVVMKLPYFHIIWSFPPENLHNIFEGVTEMFVGLHFDSKYHGKPWYLGKKVKDIDNLLLTIKPPSEVTRCPQSITKRGSWKASEWKNFLLYYSLVCYKELMANKYYQHWFLFVYSIQIFMKTKITEAEFESASEALRSFVLEIESLYGQDFMSYNVHVLLHVPKSVQNFGALWAWSAFPYEGYNAVLKGLFKGTQYVADQILKSYARLKYLKLSSTVFSKPNCSLKGKILFQSLMKECHVRRAIQYGEDLTAFGAGREYILTEREKLLVEQFLLEEVQTEAWCYDRFIFKNTLFHTSSCKTLIKRLNCVIITAEKNFLSISALLRIETNRRTCKQIILGVELQDTKEILCKNKNFVSNLTTVVKKTENIQIMYPESIERKCMCIPYKDKLCITPLLNIVETD